MLTRRFNFIELAAVMLVLGIVAYALMSRTLRYFEVAEKAAMTVTVLEVERGLRVRMALAMMQGVPVATVSARSANPFEYARATPPNYLGELNGVVDQQPLKRGNWYYATDRQELTYLPRLTSRFRGTDESPIAAIRYRLEVGDGRTTLPRLLPVVPYLWEPEYGTF